MSTEEEVRPQISLERRLDELFTDAARRAFGEVDFAATVRPSKHADYQVNGALRLAKEIGSPPREVATKLSNALTGHEAMLSSVEVAGPGFINVTFTSGYLGTVLSELNTHDQLGVEPSNPKNTYVIDYSSPNIAKSMHVGHLRTTIIGDSLSRLMEARGNTVVRNNHLGDWGTQFGMLIEYMIDTHDPDAAAQSLLTDLDALYKQARVKFDSDEDFARRARERVVLLQGGDKQTLELWNKLVDTSKQYFRKVYAELDILLRAEDDRGESFYNHLLDETVGDLEAKGLVSIDQGALCAFPPGFTGRDNEPFAMIVRKSDGGYGYFATDLATLRHSVDELHGNRLVYVTDARQAQHFAMVFAVGRQAGWIDDSIETTHIGYGMVLGEDGKPFKTRSGEVVQLRALVDEAIERAEKVMSERPNNLDDETKKVIARAVGIGALKWADLKNEHTGNYVFDFDRMLSFNGNTGPYVQYASTRAKSVLRKDGIAGPLSTFDPRQPAEHALALQLMEFATVVHRALAEYEPHQLAGYLFELAERFTSFYENCPILNAADDVKQSRLALTSLATRVLDRGMELLGITPLERM